MSKKLAVISGPSGVGKTDLVAAVEKRITASKVISCTTRRQRPSEVDGIDYRFLKNNEFLYRVAHGDFIEHAEVHGNFYGTLREDVDYRIASPEIALLVMDIQGLETISRMYPDAQTFFVVAPVLDLMRRLGSREAPVDERNERIAKLEDELVGAHSPYVQNVIDNRDGNFEFATGEICELISKNLELFLNRI